MTTTPVVTVASGHQLAVPAGLAYLRARIAGAPAGIRSARRDPAEQRELFLSRYRPAKTGSGPYGDVRYYRGVRYVRVSGEGSVAIPGSSEHETGNALDVLAGAQEWFHEYGAAFGWVPFKVRGEPWHLEYEADSDTHREETDDMLVIRRKTDKGYTYRLVVPGHPTIAVSHAAVVGIKKAGVKVAHMPTADYLRIIRTMRG